MPSLREIASFGFSAVLDQSLTVVRVTRSGAGVAWTVRGGEAADRRGRALAMLASKDGTTLLESGVRVSRRDRQPIEIVAEDDAACFERARTARARERVVLWPERSAKISLYYSRQREALRLRR